MGERNENAAKESVVLMMQGVIIGVNLSIAIRAARLSCELKIPMADSLIYVLQDKQCNCLDSGL